MYSNECGYMSISKPKDDRIATYFMLSAFRYNELTSIAF